MRIFLTFPYLFFLYFFTINQIFAQFTGGSFDGFDVYTMSGSSTLSGQNIDYFKYQGGDYDGYTLLSGVITQLNGQETSILKYAGGDYDGYTLVSGLITQLDGQQTNPLKYAGGTYDGFCLLVSNPIYLDGKSVMYHAYFGGSYDGFASALSLTDISLPVTLTLFALSEIPFNSEVKIEWRTESEIENAYWLLLRKTETDTFQTLQKLAGKGNSSDNSDYIYNDSEVEAGQTYTYQLADVSLNGHITYHKEKSIAVSVPRSFELFPNYPNPFNPITNIKFALPVPAKVQLKIYNVLGQKVADLFDQQQKAGYHLVQWNGTNNHGLSVSSGMYIYLMQAEGLANGKDERFQKVRRMILLR